VPTTSISAGKASRASDRVPIAIARRGSASAEASKSPYGREETIASNTMLLLMKMNKLQATNNDTNLEIIRSS
jgi:hypothetical protein